MSIQATARVGERCVFMPHYRRVGRAVHGGLVEWGIHPLEFSDALF